MHVKMKFCFINRISIILDILEQGTRHLMECTAFNLWQKKENLKVKLFILTVFCVLKPDFFLGEYIEDMKLEVKDEEVENINDEQFKNREGNLSSGC